jgi:hypothetical protein
VAACFSCAQMSDQPFDGLGKPVMSLHPDPAVWSRAAVLALHLNTAGSHSCRIWVFKRSPEHLEIGHFVSNWCRKGGLEPRNPAHTTEMCVHADGVATPERRIKGHRRGCGCGRRRKARLTSLARPVGRRGRRPCRRWRCHAAGRGGQGRDHHRVGLGVRRSFPRATAARARPADPGSTSPHVRYAMWWAPAAGAGHAPAAGRLHMPSCIGSQCREASRPGAPVPRTAAVGQYGAATGTR